MTSFAQISKRWRLVSREIAVVEKKFQQADRDAKRADRAITALQAERQRDVKQVAAESVRRLDKANDVLRDEFRAKNRATQVRHELETQQSAKEIGTMNDEAGVRQNMHDLLSHMHQNPGDKDVVNQMDQIASQNPRADLGSLVSQAGALHKQHLADMPPMVPCT